MRQRDPLTRLLVAVTLAIVSCGRSTPPPPMPPAFEPISVHSGIYLARIETRTSIDRTGLLHRVTVTGKSYGPHDIDPSNERIEIREGRLRDAQMLELTRLFAGWSTTEPGPAIVDGPDITIERSGRRLTGSSFSSPVQQALSLIEQYAAQMPVVPANPPAVR